MLALEAQGAFVDSRRVTEAEDIQWILEGLKKPGKSQRGLAKALGLDPSAVNRMLKGGRGVKARELSVIRAYLSAPPALDVAESEVAVISVPEYDVRVSAGGGFYIDEETRKGSWPFPASYLRNELRVNPRSSVVVEVQGDSMEPTLRSGDRVMIDMNDKNPAQPGIFVLWDSDRTVVKRVEKVPGSRPAELVLISDNKVHHEYRVQAASAQIVGRVVWRATRV